MLVLLCISILAICTLTALTVAVITHFGGRSYGSVDDGWFWTIVLGMVTLTATIIITLCNTTNWR